MAWLGSIVVYSKLEERTRRGWAAIVRILFEWRERGGHEQQYNAAPVKAEKATFLFPEVSSDSSVGQEESDVGRTGEL